MCGAQFCPTDHQLSNVDAVRHLVPRAPAIPLTDCRVHLPENMDITKTILSLREAALLYGDYGTYHTQLSKKLLNYRKKLNIATKNRGKFQKRGIVTSEQIAENHEYSHRP